jgi:hypothetical protein
VKRISCHAVDSENERGDELAVQAYKDLIDQGLDEPIADSKSDPGENSGQLNFGID